MEVAPNESTAAQVLGPYSLGILVRSRSHGRHGDRARLCNRCRGRVRDGGGLDGHAELGLHGRRGRGEPGAEHHRRLDDHHRGCRVLDDPGRPVARLFAAGAPPAAQLHARHQKPGGAWRVHCHLRVLPAGPAHHPSCRRRRVRPAPVREHRGGARDRQPGGADLFHSSRLRLDPGRRSRGAGPC